MRARVKIQKTKEKNNKILFFFKYCFFIFSKTIYLLMFLFLLLSLFLAVILLPKLDKIKNIYLSFNSIKYNANLALRDLSNKNYESSLESFEKTYENILEIEQNLDNLFHYNYPIIEFYRKNFEYVLKSAEQIDLACIEFNKVLLELDDLYKSFSVNSYKDLTVKDKKLFLEKIISSKESFVNIRKYILLSELYLDSLSSNIFLKPWQKDIGKFRDKIESVKVPLGVAIEALDIFPLLTAYDNKRTYLFLLQNNHELRPTGGFIGSYAILKIKDAEILDLYTKDVYSLDNPAGEAGFNYDPPSPFKEKFMNVHQFYFRDANWDPDFSKSAKLLKQFFEEEKAIQGEKDWDIDFIIALNPLVIEKLLDYFSGIEVNGEIYTAENFIDLLEYKVEVDWHQQGLSIEDRKNIISEITHKLKDKIFNLALLDWKDLLLLFQESLIKKDIQLYAKNSKLEDLFSEMDWAGKIKHTDGDFLMLVDANLASLKTDEVISRDLDYELKEEGKALYAYLNYTYKNKGEYSWKHTKYHSFLRVYVPLGAELVDSYKQNIESFDDLDKEKTVFSSYITVKPHETYSFKIKYKLPDFIYEQYKKQEYTFYLEKQSSVNLNVKLKLFRFNNLLKNYSDFIFNEYKSFKDEIFLQFFFNKDFEYKTYNNEKY